MKKMILIFLVFFLTLWNTFAINWDDIITHTSTIIAWNESEDVIDVWYDWIVDTVYISSEIEAHIQIFDDLTLLFDGVVSDGVIFEETFIVRDTFRIVNHDNKDISFFHSWYRFIEWTDVNFVWIPTDTVIKDNWWMLQEYEFLRQNELFNFYQIELTALLLLTMMVFLKKYSFWWRTTLKSFK